MADEQQKTPPKTDGAPIDGRVQQTTPEVKETPPTGTPAATAASKEPAQTQAAAKKEVDLIGDDDEIPADADVLKLPKKAFDRRIKNASKAELNKLYEALGVKDKAELEAWREQIAQAKTKAEEERKAKLTAEQKLTEERDAAVRERDEWKTKHAQVLNAREMSEQQSQIMKLGAKYIDEDYLEDQLPLLAKHLAKKYTDEELADLPDSVVEDWFADRVKAKPKLARDGAAPPPPAKKPLETGKKDTGAPSGNGDVVEPAKGFGVKKDASGRTIETPEEARAARDRMRQAGLSI